MSLTRALFFWVYSKFLLKLMPKGKIDKIIVDDKALLDKYKLALQPLCIGRGAIELTRVFLKVYFLVSSENWYYSI